MGDSDSSDSSDSSTIDIIDYSDSISFTLTDTMQVTFYDDEGNEIDEPAEGDDFYGQDAQFTGTQNSFYDNGDGTVTDLNTGLMWQQTPDFDQYGWEEAFDYADELTTGGYTDWRLPTVKELYSLIDFTGEIVTDANDSIPYIDTDYFYYEYVSDPYIGQFWTSTLYELGPLQEDEIEGAFGVNFGDGHIKSYETGYYYDSTETLVAPGNFVRCVRGTEGVYGVNNFSTNTDDTGAGEDTVTDSATGLMWMASNADTTMNWEDALSYAESSDYAGYDDWRLPNIKELQSLIDYDKSADSGDTWPAIDTDYFTLDCADTDSSSTTYTDGDTATWIWSSTTHGDQPGYGCYMCFGRAWSKDDSDATDYYDWHGAGAQRSDPKSGDPDDYDLSSENATDLVQIENYVLLVRDAD